MLGDPLDAIASGLALSCAQGIEGQRHTIFFLVGSDGTDGPTNAAGDIVVGK